MTARCRLFPSLFILGLFSLAIPAFAADTPAAAARAFAETAISPDGTRVAWIGPSDKPAGSEAKNDDLYVQKLDSADASPVRINTGDYAKAAAEGVAWSADSRMLAFLCEAAPGQLQLCVASADGKSIRKVMDVKGYLADPAWSPDGKSVAFLFTENAPRKAGPLEAMTPETGVIESKIYEQRLAVVDVSTGALQQISPADMYVYEFDWSPDGKQFVLTAAPGEGDANWYTAQIYRLSANGGALSSVYKPPLQVAGPRWSPDGKSIAFIAGIMSDEGSTGGDIFVVPAEGGTARNVTPKIAASPSWLTWPSAGKILFAERIDGDTGLASLEPSSGKITQIWRGPENVLNNEKVSVSADGLRSAVIRNSAAKPPEVWAGATGEWKQMTHANDGIRPSWGEVKSVHWTSDKLKVQGWLAYPADLNPGNLDPSKLDSKRRYPMVVVVHGGPAVGVSNSWPGVFFSSTLYGLTREGYFVLFPNPRGSYGQGEAFTAGNVKDFGYGDLRDILAGVDTVVKALPVDNDRVGITGWSYGGFMTMWAITQTHRFRAAVSGAGLSNWQSYYGQNDIDQWMIPYFGASVYDDPAVYAKSSPMNFIKNVKTPTLILVGERDGEVPAPQSREFWHALKALGVETQYVVYAGEGHAVAKPEHQKDIGDRLTAWFNRFLKPENGKTQ